MKGTKGTLRPPQGAYPREIQEIKYIQKNKILL